MKNEKPVKRIPQETRDKIIADWRTGQFTEREISDKYNISTGSAHKIVRNVQKDCERVVSRGIEYRRELAAIGAENAHVAYVVKNIVEEKANLLSYFDSCAAFAAKSGKEILAGNQTMRNALGLSEIALNGRKTVEPKVSESDMAKMEKILNLIFIEINKASPELLEKIMLGIAEIRKNI